MHQNSKSGSPDPWLGSHKVNKNGTTEFPWKGFLLVFNSDCKPTTYHLATVHKRGQPTINQPTTSLHGTSQYVSHTIVSEAHKI